MQVYILAITHQALQRLLIVVGRAVASGFAKCGYLALDKAEHSLALGFDSFMGPYSAGAHTISGNFYYCHTFVS